MIRTDLYGYHHVLRLMLLGVVSIVAGCAQFGTPPSLPDSGTAAESIAARYVQGSIHSVETADQALAEIRVEREKIERRFAEEEWGCYDRFFTNLCLTGIEERKRSAMQQLRQVELEANAFKRRDKAKRREARQTQGRELQHLQFPANAAAASASPQQSTK